MSLLSVIIPAFNEEENIPYTAEKVTDVLTASQIDYELIFIDDGSTDHTFELIQQAAKHNAKVRGAKFSRNFGKESSIFAGLSLAKGDCCVVIDCDLQHPPEVIPKMYRLWEQGFEVVEGVKASRGKENAFHKFSAGLFYKLISKFTGVDMESSSDFKLLDRKVIDVLSALPERSTFFRALSFWTGFHSTKVEFEVAQRERGTSKWSLKSLIKYAVTNITSFTAAPLQIVTMLGALLIICSLILGIQTLVRYFMHLSLSGFTTVILLLLIIGGAIMVSLGIIGHYLSRIYEEIKGRPRFIISEMTGTQNK